MTAPRAFSTLGAMKSHDPTCSSLEMLEGRIAPANFSAVLEGGILKVTSTDPTVAGDVVIKQTGPDDFDVLFGMMVQSSFQEVKGIAIRGGNLVDMIDVDLLIGSGASFVGSIAADLSTGGADNFELLDGDLNGDLRVKLAEGAGAGLSAGAVVRGLWQVKGSGPGIEVVSLGSVGEVALSGVDSVNFGGGIVGGPAKIVGRTDSPLNVQFLTSPGFLSSLNIKHPGSEQTEVTVNGGLFGGPVKIALGDGTNLFTATNTAFLGGLSVKGGADADTLSFVGGNLGAKNTLDVGGGTDSLTFATNVSVVGSMAVKATGAGGKLTLGVSSAIFASGLAVQVPRGDLSLDFTGGSVLGGLSILNGNGKLTFSVSGSGSIAGPVDIRAGGGENTITAFNAGLVRDFQYVGGSGVDTLNLNVTSAFLLRADVNLGGGDDFMTVTGVDLVALKLNGGSGDDVLTVPTALNQALVTLKGVEDVMTV